MDNSRKRKYDDDSSGEQSQEKKQRLEECFVVAFDIGTRRSGFAYGKKNSDDVRNSIFLFHPSLNPQVSIFTESHPTWQGLW
jgi:hypothetical protein